MSTGGNPNAARIKELNDTIRYTMWSVFRLDRVLGDADRAAEAREVDQLIGRLAADGRGRSSPSTWDSSQWVRSIRARSSRRSASVSP